MLQFCCRSFTYFNHFPPLSFLISHFKWPRQYLFKCKSSRSCHIKSPWSNPNGSTPPKGFSTIPPDRLFFWFVLHKLPSTSPICSPPQPSTPSFNIMLFTIIQQSCCLLCEAYPFSTRSHSICRCNLPHFVIWKLDCRFSPRKGQSKPLHQSFTNRTGLIARHVKSCPEPDLSAPFFTKRGSTITSHGLQPFLLVSPVFFESCPVSSAFITFLLILSSRHALHIEKKNLYMWRKILVPRRIYFTRILNLKE